MIPAHARHARLCRLVASGVATSAGLDYEGVSDFRIAVDELVSTLIQSTREAVTLRFWIEPTAIAVEGHSTGPKREEPAVDRLVLSRQILDVVADEYEYGVDDGVAFFSLVKRTGPGRDGGASDPSAGPRHRLTSVTALAPRARPR